MLGQLDWPSLQQRWETAKFVDLLWKMLNTTVHTDQTRSKPESFQTDNHETMTDTLYKRSAEPSNNHVTFFYSAIPHWAMLGSMQKKIYLLLAYYSYTYSPVNGSG